MSIVIAPNVPPPAAQSAATAADVVLQAGSVVSAQVVQLLGNDQVRIAVAGQLIDVLSQVPLQAGQTLQLQVLPTASGVALTVVDPQAAAALAGQGPAYATSIALTGDAAAAIAALPAPGATDSSNALTPLETLAVSIAAESAASQQASLAPLFANLGVAADLPGFAPQVQQAVAQVLAQQTSLDPNLTGNDIKQAFQASGLFLEASLASGSIPPTNAVPDLKAALIVLRQALATSLGGATAAGSTAGTLAAPAPATVPQASISPEAPGLPGEPKLATAPQATTNSAAVSAPAGQPGVQFSPQALAILGAAETPLAESPSVAPQVAPATAPPAATSPSDAAARAAASNAALNLLQEALQAGPLAAANPSRLVLQNGQVLSLIPAAAGARAPAVDEAESARTSLPPPPINGALPAAQPVAPATLSAHAPLQQALQHLLADTDGALARQTLLQIASLPSQADPAAARQDAAAPRWNFEIPFATPQGTAVAQFEISRDGAGNAAEPASRTWRARFSLDVEPAGPVHALVSLNGERTSVRMWAERPATASQLRAGVSQLSQALSRADLKPGDIVVRDGAPRQAASARAGHFLDRAL
jgi:Flagellar hook-length control protein FliK